ncbi:hypothetical protein HMPREF1986_01106 [Oribacterium sp. oral taxon 078 str. F0263]|nr:hypothetical protein HMPREF1986_01106 [Oribacterium sp. oral taxon 078 str. F0263]
MENGRERCGRAKKMRNRTEHATIRKAKAGGMSWKEILSVFRNTR